MSDSVQLTQPLESERIVWLYRLEDGSLRLSEGDVRHFAAGERNAGPWLTIPPESVDRLAFALLVDRYRGCAGTVKDVRRLLCSEDIAHFFEQGP
jgi:hypothetical protein